MSSLFADTHNVVAILEKSDAAEGFEQIIDFLSGSYIHYALTVNPHIYILCIKQFWNTASVKRSGAVTRLQALVDKKKIVISEVVIRKILQLDDAEGVNQVGDLSTHTTRFISPALTQKVFANMRRVGKEGQIQADAAGAAAVQETVIENGRMIDDLDKDEGIELVVDQVKDADIAETEGRHAVEQAKNRQRYIIWIWIILLNAASATISAAKPSIPIAAKPSILAASPIVVAAYTRRRKGINKDNEEINKDIDWDAAIDHVKQQSMGNQYIKRYHGMKKRPQTESEARKNMMTYLKNTDGYKIDFFKGMSYDEIRPIFQARFDANMRFLLKSSEEMEEEDQEVFKSINETPAQKAAKRRKLNKKAQEVKDLKKHLEIVNDEDDDVFTEATPLGRKVLIVDYQIVVINNKPRFKIIKADETHQLYISFITLLKNFDREDLEDLWGIVKERFSTSKPSNFSDDYLLATLKTMFEKPNGQDAVWKSQNSVYGQALVKGWKLLTSCGVHIFSLATTKFILLVERRYPLSKFTLEQLVNVTKLQIEEESEMSLELLRFTRQQLQEYQQG
nr:hypothetical protein [Tanacetum cinerariifolium]